MIDPQGRVAAERIVSRSFPPFRPHPLLASGHAQTLAGVYLPGPVHPYRARQHRVTLSDGDTIVLRDDPMIPPECLERIHLPPAVRLHVSDRGGHLGFVGRGGVDADRRWMDWRVVDWVATDGARAALPRAVRA